jgi:hypothetical protein
VVFYYQVYDGQGKRLCGHSTGKTTKTAAREFCNQLLKAGKLMPEKVKPMRKKRSGDGAVCVNGMEIRNIAGRFFFRTEKAAVFETMTEGQAG